MPILFVFAGGLGAAVASLFENSWVSGIFGWSTFFAISGAIVWLDDSMEKDKRKAAVEAERKRLEENPTPKERFDRTFVRLPGTQRIVVEEPTQRLITMDGRRPVEASACGRRYRPTYDPPPWELQVLAGDGWDERFALVVHPELEDVSVRIYPTEKRPVDIALAYAEATAAVPCDPFHEGRYRYAHADQGPSEWFVVRVRAPGGMSWCFEHESLLRGRIVAARAAAEQERQRQRALERASSSSQAAPKDSGRVKRIRRELEEVRRTTAKDVGQMRAMAAEITAQFDALRKELPELVKKERRREESPEAFEAKLAQLPQLLATVKRVNELIETTEGLDTESKLELQDIADGARAACLARFKRSITDEFAAPLGRRA